NLGLEGRVRLYAVIWDEVEEFTNLLRLLLQALESLGHPDLAYCSLEALIPRSGSIIDVATLAGLDGGESSDKPLEVVTSEGRKVTLPRAVVTALTAELTIVMAESPADYFNYTDLLDFPGYRSRYKIENVRQELKKPGMLKEMFLRGKVAYLFQRYCNERELTSMLLCIGPSNQEVQDLPGVINAWVGQTHGTTPALRTGREVSLFFILTKFDMEFEQKKGAPSVETRWDNRLHASLLDFFGKQHDWPTEWDQNHAFQNIFLLRNPNFRFDAILNYDNQGRELGIRPEMQAYVDELKAAFFKSALVAAHFKDLGKAWEAAMRLNDGGITYIREALSPLCNPKIKTEQLKQSLAEACKQLERRLGAFYRTSDTAKLLKQKFAMARKIGQALGKLEKDFQRLGLLLRAMTVTDAEIFELYPEALRRYLSKPEEELPKEKAASSEVEEIDLSEFSLEDWNPLGESKEEDNSSSKSYVRDEASFFAEYIEATWIAKLHALADDPIMQKYYHLPAAEFSAFVSELAIGAVRYDLRAQMISDFHKAAEYVNTQKESIVWQEAAIAANLINSYIDWLGLDPRKKNKAEREIKLGSSVIEVFKPKSPVEGQLKLPESRQESALSYFYDWLNAFMGLVLGNVSFDGEQEIDLEQNAKLEK
ncbi:MAG: type III effector HopL1, partial [Desulfovibrionaceae bacterium]|nr:type III effector HopL1 [Desulfovibrionaceae bacterium]